MLPLLLDTSLGGRLCFQQEIHPLFTQLSFSLFHLHVPVYCGYPYSGQLPALLFLVLDSSMPLVEWPMLT